MKTNVNILKALALSGILFLGSFSAMAETDPKESIVTETVALSEVKVNVTDNGVEIILTGENSLELTIYALTGQILKSQTVTPGVTSIDLSRGYYIVRNGREAKRIVIR